MSPRGFSDKGDVGEAGGALVGQMGWWRGDREGVVGTAWLGQWMERSKLSIGSGERGRVVSGEEGVVRGGGVSGMWG